MLTSADKGERVGLTNDASIDKQKCFGRQRRRGLKTFPFLANIIFEQPLNFRDLL